MIEAGREELTKEFRREGLPLQRMWDSEILAEEVASSSYTDLDSVLAAIGEHHVSARSIVQKVARSFSQGDGRRAVLVVSPHPTRSAQPSAIRRRRPRRGARRRPRAAVALLHSGARRRHHRLRHSWSRRVRAPRRLRQRREPDERSGGAADRRRVGRRPLARRSSGPASKSSRSTARGCCATWPTRSASSTSTSSRAAPTPATTVSPRCASSSSSPTPATSSRCCARSSTSTASTTPTDWCPAKAADCFAVIKSTVATVPAIAGSCCGEAQRLASERVARHPASLPRSGRNHGVTRPDRRAVALTDHARVPDQPRDARHPAAGVGALATIRQRCSPMSSSRPATGRSSRRCWRTSASSSASVMPPTWSPRRCTTSSTRAVATSPFVRS